MTGRRPDGSRQPLLGEAVAGLKLRVFMQQGGTEMESSRGNPGIRQGKGMGGPNWEMSRSRSVEIKCTELQHGEPGELEVADAACQVFAAPVA
jgi:hypothetical protein